MGPWAGWMGGWAIIVADVIVMANLAQIAGLYSFLLVGWDSAAASTFAVTLVGVIWIAVMTAICVIGIELSARTQVGLLGAELITLVLFAVFALVKVATGDAGPEAVDFSFSWLNPFEIDSFDALIAGVLIAVFIYWGWDSTVTVNEESRNSNEGPGKAALMATVILLAHLRDRRDRRAVLRRPAAADRQRRRRAQRARHAGVRVALGQDPDHRGADLGGGVDADDDPADRPHQPLDGARAARCRAALGRIHPRYLTPHVSTILMGALSIVWYVGLTIVSENILFDSIAALGLMIAFYYGITGFACAIYYRRELLRSVKTFLLIGVGPTLGGADAARHLRQVLLRPVQAGELGVGRLLVRARAAARDRPRLPGARRAC